MLRYLSIGVFVAAVGLGCSSDESKDKKKPGGKAPSTKTKPADDKAKPTPAPGRSGCSLVRRMATNGTATIEYVAGKDTMQMDVKDGKVGLRTGSVMTGRALRLQLRASYADANVNGRSVCVAVSRLMFVYHGKTPEAGKQVAYKFTGEPTNLRRQRTTQFYVDINEQKKVINTGKPTIEYMGTEGSFTFTKVNESADGEFKHTLRFDVVFQKVKDSKLDPSVKTKLSGEISFDTRRKL